MKESLLEVLDYADMGYVGRCEEIGEVCIENIDKIRKAVIDDCEVELMRIIESSETKEALKVKVKESMERLREE